MTMNKTLHNIFQFFFRHPRDWEAEPHQFNYNLPARCTKPWTNTEAKCFAIHMANKNGGGL